MPSVSCLTSRVWPRWGRAFVVTLIVTLVTACTGGELTSPSVESLSPLPEAPSSSPEVPAPSPEEPSASPEEPSASPEEPAPSPEEPAPSPEEPAPAPAPTVASIHLTPGGADLITQDTIQFAAYGRMSDGDSVAVAVQWSATGGTIDNAGRFVSALEPGAYMVIATHADGLADTAAVTVVHEIVRILITPTGVQLAPGESQQFGAHGLTATGDTIPVEVVWSASGGTITADGLFTAGLDSGSYQIVATLVDPELPTLARSRAARPVPTRIAGMVSETR